MARLNGPVYERRRGPSSPGTVATLHEAVRARSLVSRVGKRLELATLFCALAVTVVPAARGVLAGYTDLLRQAEGFVFHGGRYVLAPAGETDQAGWAVRFSDFENAHTSLPELPLVDRVCALRQ